METDEHSQNGVGKKVNTHQILQCKPNPAGCGCSLYWSFEPRSFLRLDILLYFQMLLSTVLCLTWILCLQKKGRVPDPVWTVHPQRPDDASLSCYLSSNNTWVCMDDKYFEVDADDSY